MTARRFALWIALVCGFVSCRKPPPPEPAPSWDAGEVAPTPPATTGLAPLRDVSWLESLTLEGFGDASVSVPVGATEPRPVVVALHGSGDRPEWACGEWRGVTDAYPFILCPHGTPIRASKKSGLVFADAATTTREISAGLAALEARFGRYLARGPNVLVGFSLGAILGVRIITDRPLQFPLAMLAEGGHELWTPERVKRFQAGGGRRVLIGCTTGACEAATRPLLPRLESAGISTKMVSAGRIGHLVDDRVVRAFRPEFRWLVSDDPRFGPVARQR